MFQLSKSQISDFSSANLHGINIASSSMKETDQEDSWSIFMFLGPIVLKSRDIRFFAIG